MCDTFPQVPVQQTLCSFVWSCLKFLNLCPILEPPLQCVFDTRTIETELLPRTLLILLHRNPVFGRQYNHCSHSSTHYPAQHKLATFSCNCRPHEFARNASQISATEAEFLFSLDTGRERRAVVDGSCSSKLTPSRLNDEYDDKNICARALSPLGQKNLLLRHSRLTGPRAENGVPLKIIPHPKCRFFSSLC